MMLENVAAAVGKGLFVGLVGTTAMTLSQELEMKLSGREPSYTPAALGSKLLGVEPQSEEEKAHFSSIVHWSLGTVWGTARELIGLGGLQGLAAVATHLALMWITDCTVFALLGVAPPPWEWKVEEVALDMFHKLVYAIAVNVAYELLER